MKKVTVRLWGGTLVDGERLKKCGPFTLVVWTVRESWDGEPYAIYRHSRWYPSWRVMEGRVG